jgi:hypothetical protein
MYFPSISLWRSYVDEVIFITSLGVTHNKHFPKKSLQIFPQGVPLGKKNCARSKRAKTKLPLEENNLLKFSRLLLLKNFSKIDLNLMMFVNFIYSIVYL